jgi:carboxyl-terminal processing protease
MMSYCYRLLIIGLLLALLINVNSWAGSVNLRSSNHGANKHATSRLFTDPATAPTANNLKIFDKVWQTIYEKYYDPKFNGVDWAKARAVFRPRAAGAQSEKELYQVLTEMLDQLHDRHVYINSPTRMDDLQDRAVPRLGLILRLVEERWVVTEVTAGSSVAEAGVAVGWILIEYDGRQFGAQDRLPPLPIGQPLILKFLDAYNNEQRVAFTCCKEVKITPIQQAARINSEVLYLRLDEFVADTPKFLVAALAQHSTVKTLVLDLRNNSGGSVAALEETLGAILPEKRLIGMYTERNGRGQKVQTRGKLKFGGQVWVLISESTGSSAEIFAATIQEAGRGRVVGQKSPGYVLPSVSVDLPDGGRLQYSVADFHTAKGRRLEGQGVIPDLLMSPSLVDARRQEDTVIKKVWELLKIVN